LLPRLETKFSINGDLPRGEQFLHFVGGDTWKIFRYPVSVSTVPEIERAIEALPKQEFERLAAWFAEKREQAVDAAFDQAIGAGEFDAMADRALSDHAAGKSRPLDEFLDRA
jgi:hypothetical protein